MAEVNGAVAAGFEGIRDAFATAQAADPGGAQLCIYREGAVVVDLWTGWDATNDRAYGADTLTVLMSCTKAVTAICAHMLAERGLLDLDAPMARAWPQFAAAGKEEMTLAQVLSHTSGLAVFDADDGMDASAMLDETRCVATLAAMRPLWAPGTARLYHFVNFGYLVGEMVRRVTGRSIGTFVAEEIAAPLGAELWIGLPEAQQRRVARHFRTGARMDAAQWRALFSGLGVDPDGRITASLITGMVAVDALIHLMNESSARRVELAAGNGIGSARGLARIYAATIGEVDGVRLLSAKTVETARFPRTDALGPPPPLPAIGGPPQRFGLGFELPRPIVTMLGDGSFGHPGAGGRLAFAHPESGVAAAYVCNNMLWDDQTADPRWAWCEALREVVGDMNSHPDLKHHNNGRSLPPPGGGEREV